MLNDLWRTTALYTDGGCIERNPSSLGGTFAWCYVVDDELVKAASGVWPTGTRPVTNNLMEYMAAILGLEALPAGWSGHLCSDSQVTLGRLFWDWKHDGIPMALMGRAERALVRLGTVEPILLQGHPTRADLACGIGKKRGLPVSPWNQWCDERCRDEAQRYLASQQERVEVSP